MFVCIWMAKRVSATKQRLPIARVDPHNQMTCLELDVAQGECTEWGWMFKFVYSMERKCYLHCISSDSGPIRGGIGFKIHLREKRGSKLLSESIKFQALQIQ